MLSSLSATTVVVLPSESVPSSLSSSPPQILSLNHRNLHARVRQLTYLLYTAAAITTHAPHQYTHSNFFLCYSTKNSPFTAISQTAADFLTSRTTSRTLLKTLQNVVEQAPQKQSGIGCKYFVIFLVVARDLTPEIACLHGRIFSLRTYASNDRTESHVSNLLAG